MFRGVAGGAKLKRAVADYVMSGLFARFSDE